jgi:cyanophycin synthetase
VITILNAEFYFWRNRHARVPVLLAQLRLDGPAEEMSEAGLATLRQRLPGLPPLSGIIDPVVLVAEIAQQFQLGADVTAANCGVAANGGGAAAIFFAARDHHTASVSLSAGVEIVNGLTLPAGQADIPNLIQVCSDAVYDTGFDQSSRAMIAAAEARGIPWHRLIGSHRHIQWGQGARAQWSRETLTSRQSALGRELARSKATTFELLSQYGLPVGKYAPVTSRNSGIAAAETVGYPLVLKRVVGTKGNNVYVNLRDRAELDDALAKAAVIKEEFVLQSYFPGDDYRLLVVKDRLVVATRRIPAEVTGDGTHNIVQLVAAANRDPRRGKGFEKIMAFIELDDETARVLAAQELTQNDVPAAGRRVRLRATANIATGGLAVDVTNQVHADNAAVAIRAAKVLDVEVAGVDLITPDITRSWREVGGGICEVNIFPGLRVHYGGDPDCDAAGPIVETMFPPGNNGRIPTVLIAGPGAAAAALLLGRIFKSAGHVAGIAAGGEIRIGDSVVSYPEETSPTPLVLRDPAVTAAVIEIAPASLHEGIPLDRCDVVAIIAGCRWDDPSHAEALMLTATKAVVLPADDAPNIALAKSPVIRVREATPEAVAAAIAKALRLGA